MGIYDWNNEYKPKVDHTIAKLCRELIKESSDFSAYSVENMRKKLFNGAKTGLGDRLEKHLFYDIRKNADIYPKDKFEMFQLLKVLFFIENEGVFPSGEKYSKENGFPLISLLAKPRLGHINSLYSSNNVYGNYLDILINTISKKIDPFRIRKEELENIDKSWCGFINEIFEYCNPDLALERHDFSLEQLKRINHFLSNVLSLMKKHSKIKIDSKGKFMVDIKYKEGVLKTFYNILYYNISRSYDLQAARENKLVFKTNKSKLCNDYYSQHRNMLVSIDIINELLEQLKNKVDDSSNDNCNIFLNLITMNIEDCKEKDVIFALEHINPLLRLFEKEMKSNFLNGVEIDLLVAISQEIIYVHNTNPSILDDTHDYSTGNKALKSIYTGKRNSTQYKKCDIDSIPAIIKVVWMDRVMARWLINLGLFDIVEIYMCNKKIVSDIKNELFYYTNFEDVINITRVILENFAIAKNEEFKEYAIEDAINAIERYLKAI